MGVTSLEITRRTRLADGKAFGSVGPYEHIQGRAHFAVDPDHERNAGITDLKLAARSEDGRVHFTADFALVQPAEPGRGSGRLLYHVVNRGRKTLGGFNDVPTATGGGELDPGNGFLMRQGYTMAWCGWQHDVPFQPGLMALHTPEALEDGAPLSGRIMCELEPQQPTQVLLLADRDHRPYPALDIADPTAVLTVREHVEAPRQTIARDLWQFAHLKDGRPVPDPARIYLSSGFEPGKFYDLY